ncbi:tetratricopeptide repeat protein [Xanthovirga aplysinae]|uniref:tetratricopeptide repeat protein n=1 Tax=Xanthovirga aplysinae TaxID=2529853 RepID=UPI0012BB7EF3|nr:tetratricopeptide repeat protein [Xanthovirga aplysinae]MTI33429.1 tetratricopeptide repeat protein [Xanthovirga aplysinae]
MKQKHKQKEEFHSTSDFLERPEALQQEISRTEEFIRTNRTVVFSLGGLCALIIAAYFGYKYYNDNQNVAAQREMFQAVRYFEEEDYANALNGDGNNLGLIDIMDDYGSTKAANLAQYYTGVIHLKQGEYDEAIDFLGKFSADDVAVQARAYALIGDAYMEKGDFSEAAKFYSKAADFNANKFFSPQYLMKNALALEKNGDLRGAEASYDKIVKEYASAYEYQEARKQKARLSALASK